MKRHLVVCAALVLAAGVASSQTATPVVRDRQVKQQVRIHEGVKSGELTKKEAVKLEAQQKHIQHAKVRAKSDGVVTPGEKAKLHNMQDRASKNIYKQKHDGQKR